METFSISRLEELTGVNRRTIKKYLTNFAPDKTVGKRHQYSIRTVCTALAPLLGDAPNPEEKDVTKMSPKDQKDWYESQNKRLQYETSLRELIPVDEVIGVVSEAFKLVVFSLDTLPDKIELEVGLQADQLRVMLRTIDEARESLALSLDDYLNDLDEDGTDGSSQSEDDA